MTVVEARGRCARVPNWMWLLIVAASLATAFEMVLLANVTGLFTHGFNSGQIRGPLSLAGFVGLSLVLDAAYLVVLWSLLVPLLRLLRVEQMKACFLLVFVSVGVVAIQSIYRYGLFSIVGDMLDQRVLDHITIGGSSSVALEAFEDFPVTWLLVLAIVMIGFALGTWFVDRLGSQNPNLAARFHLPRTRSLLAFFAVTFLIAAGASRVVHRDSFRYGVARKASGNTFERALSWITDVDRDGYGLVTVPVDPAPFDSARTPYTSEIPGNGNDENGLAGDLPADFASAPSVSEPMPDPSDRPHLLLIYLESFRVDAIGSEIHGQAVTPALDELTRTGVASSNAYCHVGWTVSSRAQLFNGAVVPAYGQSTIVDDFKQLGYHVGYFSGQDESFGRSEELTGARRAHVFFDARDEVDRRTSRSTAPASLQISWRTLEQHVSGYLNEIDPSQPQFLYVNIVDTHYPYTHDELDDILGVPHLDRDEIRSEYSDRLRAGYARSVANVDRAVGRLVKRWRAAIGNADHAILVLSDHGEALYDEGFLGHGFTLEDAAMRIPFILWGMGGDWPEPVVPSDVRGLLRRNLFIERAASPPRARFVQVPGRSIIQYAPNLTEPTRIGLRSIDQLAVYDFTSRQFIPSSRPGASKDPAMAHDGVYEELIWRWEEAQAERLRLGRLR